MKTSQGSGRLGVLVEEGTQHIRGGQSIHPSLELTIGSDDRVDPRASVIGQGDRVGRYLVIREVGRGGMGAVYAAYDPELDRKVALKLVRFRDDHSGDASRTRLLREAQAMARVTHSNVITVHDVGVHHDQIYVAMEFIEGMTVKAWCAAARTWAEVVEVFRQAGGGLAAAHEQGLVHRDFKPENVMIVARSARVVVLDFGLARGSELTESRDVAITRDPGASMSGLLSTEVTRAGDIMGTPAYMSPEQFARGDVDASSDQFSFCVSFYEGLYGQRPFRGDSAAALVYAIQAGAVAPDDSGRGVPAWLRRIVVRGLAPDPADRWPSMNALLAALAAARPRRRRIAIAVASVLSATAVAIGLASGIGSSEELCSGAQRHLDGVWDDARRDQANAHVESLALPWFEQSWQSTVVQLDEYAAQWTAIHQDACEATNRHGEQSERVMDMRMSCLGRARVELGATTDRLLALDEAGALRVHELVEGLPSLARCSDVSALESDVEPPRDSAMQAEVDEVRESIASARAGLRMGKTEAVDSLTAMNERVMAVGYPPVHAEYLVELGRAQRFAGHPDQARVSLEQGLRIALGNGQRELAIDGLAMLTMVAGSDLQRPPEAMIYARVSEGIASGPGVAAESTRLSQRALADALHATGQYEAALATYRAVLDATPVDRELERAAALAGQATVHELESRFEAAEQTYREVLELHRTLLGEGHPNLATDHSNLGNALMLQRRYPEAEAEHRKALAIDSAIFPADHPAIAGSHANLGATLGAAGQREAAEVEFRAVLEIIGETHPRAPLVHGNLGTLALDQEDYVEAEREYRLALQLYAGTVGVDHPATIVVHSTLGAALDGQARHVEAEAEHRTSLTIALAAHGEDHDLVAKARQRLGMNLVEQARPSEAIELLELALAHRIAHAAEASTIATTRFALARALWDSHRDRARARELAEAALAGFGSQTKRADEVRAWLDELP